MPGDSVQDRPHSFPVFRTREQMDTYLRGLGYMKLDKLNAVKESTEERQRLAEALKNDPHTNGNAEALVDHLQLNHQELERKESWYKRILKLPGKAVRWTWETVKKHPILTTAVVASILLYYTGWGKLGWEWGKGWYAGLDEGSWLKQFVGKVTSYFSSAEAAPAAEVAAEAAPEVAAGAAEAAKDVVQVAIDGTNVVIDGVAYDPKTQVEAFTEAIKSLEGVKGVEIFRDATSTVQAREALEEMLIQHKIPLKFLPTE